MTTAPTPPSVGSPGVQAGSELGVRMTEPEIVASPTGGGGGGGGGGGLPGGAWRYPHSSQPPPASAPASPPIFEYRETNVPDEADANTVSGIRRAISPDWFPCLAIARNRMVRSSPESRSYTADSPPSVPVPAS